MATVLGDNLIFESVRTTIFSLLDALKTAMENASTDPLPLAVYNTHDQVKMTLPAYSVDFNGVVNDGDGRVKGIKATGSGIILGRYPLVVSIRTHTAFQGEFRDRVKLARLLNSVNNYMQTHRDLTAMNTACVQFMVTNFEPITMDNEFEESLTIGGEMILSIVVNVGHTQA